MQNYCQLHYENSEQPVTGRWGPQSTYLKSRFPSFREVLLTRTTSTNFFPPCSPSATCIRLPVYFLLIAWAKCPGGKMFSPELNYSSAMSGYCRIDCLQSAFSLKIRLVLDHIQRDCKPRCYQADLATERERYLTTGKRAERTKLYFRFLICRSANGQASCLICARRRQLTFPFCC